jgi:cytochrome b6-f complex iron-sulfur subunit
MRQHSTYGEVLGPRAGEISRRSFMRRMLGVGVGLLSLEFLGGTLAFLWPNLTGGLGGKVELGSAKDIDATNPDWKNGLPFVYNKARLFLVNVPASENLVLGKNEAVPDPGDKVKALYRKCPHLGCQIPQLCDKSHWFECLCHGSKYTVLGEKRDGPAPRGMDGFNVTVANAVYVVDTSQIVTGPPIGTATFDNRGPGDMQHCTG